MSQTDQPTPTEVPWRTDRPLDAEIVRAALGEQFPSFEAGSIAPLAEGWDFEAYLVDDRWVFRFPKRAECDGSLLTEGAVLDQFGPALPVPTPRYQFRGHPCKAFPYHFGGYACLPGEPAPNVTMPPQAMAPAAAQLGRFLDCLHRCEAEYPWALGLREDRDPASRPDETRRHLADLREHIGPDRHARCVALVGDASGTPPPYAGPLRLLHCDLTAEHILLSPATGAVAGILDWSDAALGDPARDFTGLWMWRGDSFVAEALRHYGLPVDAGFRDRVRHRGLTVLVGELYYAMIRGWGDSAAFARECLSRRLAEIPE